MSDIITDDSNVAPSVDMDLLVDDQPNPDDDYLQAVGKEPVEQNPDPDKVVNADLAMDPAAATEGLISPDYSKSIENHKYRLNVGISDYHKDLVAIKVVGKKFPFNDAFQSFESFERSPYGTYAYESMRDSFTEVQKPVSNKDFANYKQSFENLLSKHMRKFIKTVMNPKISTKCSYSVNDSDIYGTVSLNVRFKKADGTKLPLGAVYGCEWYNGKPALTPIVPLMKIDERSEEKYTGWLRKKDFMDIDNVRKLPHNFDDLMKIPAVKEKIKLFKDEMSEKGYELASVKEANNNKRTFWTILTGRSNQRSDFLANDAHMKLVDGVVWFYTYQNNEFGFTSILNPYIAYISSIKKLLNLATKKQRMNIFGLVKTKNGKIKAMPFGINILMIREKIKVENATESYTEFNFDDALELD